MRHGVVNRSNAQSIWHNTMTLAHRQPAPSASLAFKRNTAAPLARNGKLWHAHNGWRKHLFIAPYLRL